MRALRKFRVLVLSRSKTFESLQLLSQIHLLSLRSALSFFGNSKKSRILQFFKIASLFVLRVQVKIANNKLFRVTIIQRECCLQIFYLNKQILYLRKFYLKKGWGQMKAMLQLLGRIRLVEDVSTIKRSLKSINLGSCNFRKKNSSQKLSRTIKRQKFICI